MTVSLPIFSKESKLIRPLTMFFRKLDKCARLVAAKAQLFYCVCRQAKHILWTEEYIFDFTLLLQPQLAGTSQATEQPQPYRQDV